MKYKLLICLPVLLFSNCTSTVNNHTYRQGTISHNKQINRAIKIGDSYIEARDKLIEMGYEVHNSKTNQLCINAYANEQTSALLGLAFRHRDWSISMYHDGSKVTSITTSYNSYIPIDL